MYGKALLFQPGDISSRNKTYPKAVIRAAGAESHHTFPFPGTVTSPHRGFADSQQLGICSAWTSHLMSQCRPPMGMEPVQYHCSSTGLTILSSHNGSRIIRKKGSGQIPSWYERLHHPLLQQQESQPPLGTPETRCLHVHWVFKLLPLRRRSNQDRSWRRVAQITLKQIVGVGFTPEYPDCSPYLPLLLFPFI